jgi:hypothetical protein
VEYRAPEGAKGVPGAEKPGIVGRVTSGVRLKFVKTGSNFVAFFEDRFFFQMRQNATSPPIRERPTKPPTLAAITPILLEEPAGADVYPGDGLVLDIPLDVAGGGPSDLSVLLAMFILKISMVCTFRSATIASVEKKEDSTETS